MKLILSNFSASISELKKNPSGLLRESSGAPIAILNHNTPAAYLIPAETYEILMEQLEDIELSKLVSERLNEKSQAIKVSIDDL